MGKRYYCDYCDKTMVSAASTIKTHIKGLAHQKLVSDHYQQYKDYETVLAEESVKKPCSRYPRGECLFGSICRFSHYSPEQIDELRVLVAAKKRAETNTAQPSFEYLYQKLQDEKSQPQKSDEKNTVIYDTNGVTFVFPWVYNSVLDDYGDNLPPSIRRFKIEDFQTAHITGWG